jgi:lipoprotein-anchoring transpeptidase ErfK/SrfK
MTAWKDEEKAAELLSGSPRFPASQWRVYAIGALTIFVTAAVAIGVLRLRAKGIAPASAEVAVSEAAPAPATAAPTETQKPPPAVASSEIIVLPTVVIGEKPAQASAIASEGAGALVTAGAGSNCPTDAKTVLAEARRTEEGAGGDLAALEKARALYQQALDAGALAEKEEAECAARLTELANRILLDPKARCTAPAAVLHKVAPGDVVEKIARQYKVNQGQIKRINRLNDKLAIRVGQTLKMLPGEVVYKVSRTTLTGTLYIAGVFVRRYPVGIGPGNATPVGSYLVERKVVNPDWYYDGKRIPFGDAANILGTRWMAFSCEDNAQAAGLGIHGTSKPESVPGRESKGCVRMLNQDVEELYDLMPQGGRVYIAD